MPDVVSVYKDEDRLIYLAYWYDRLARHLLRSKLITFEEWSRSKNYSRFDLYSSEVSACIEIKGSSNLDQFKLFTDQLDGQAQELGFPFDSGFFWIFSYKNEKRIDGRHTRILRENGKTPENLERFLAKNTNVAYAIDFHLLNALRKSNGTKEYKRDIFNPRKTVSINRTQLREISFDIRSVLINVGLEKDVPKFVPPKARRTISRQVETLMDGNFIGFKMVLLVPNALKVRLLKQMNGDVRKI